MSYNLKTTEPGEEFLDAGKKNGILVWRIENFGVKKLKKQEYGKFYTGDSYLVLYTNIENNEFRIHYWLGAESSIDEYGTCALKAIELDDYLGGKPIQYREIQNHESKLFLALFQETGLRYLNGGYPSGFNKISDDKNDPFLYMVKGKREIRIVQVPFTIDSLNKSDVFILDNNDTIYQWNPPGSNKMEQLKATVFSKKIRDDDHSGRSQLVVIDSDEWDKNRDFWNLLPGDIDQIKDESEVKDHEFERSFKSSEITLYKVSDEDGGDAHIHLVQNGELKQELLDHKDCFIVDSQEKGIFCWIGRNCTKNEKKATVIGAKDLMTQKNYPNYIPCTSIIDGGEPTAFKSLFRDWQ